MEENKRTDKKVLYKGIKQMIICLILMFTGPSLLHVSFSNEHKPMYLTLLITSLIICISAILMLFLGLNTIMKSIFNKK